MAVQKTLNKLDNVLLYLIPNCSRENNGVTEYCPWALKLTGVATDEAGTKKQAVEYHYWGSWQTEKRTDSELYLLLKNTSNANNLLANAVKELYVNAINEDISS